MRTITDEPSPPRRVGRSQFSRTVPGILASLIALLIGLSGSLCTGESSPGLAARVEKQSAGQAEIPFELYNDNLILVKGNIGSLEAVNIILDTGTSPTVVSREVANQIGLRGTSGSLLTLTGATPARKVELSHIRIGGWSAESVPAVVQDVSFLERKLGVSIGGIAGLDILSTASFSIDYRRKKIVFGLMAVNRKSVRFETGAPCLTVKAKIEGQEVRLLVDSGTRGLLVYRNRIKIGHLGSGGDAWIETADGMKRSRWFLASNISLGEKKLGRHAVAIADVDRAPEGDFDGLLGFASLGFHRVSFDFENGLFGWE